MSQILSREAWHASVSGLVLSFRFQFRWVFQAMARGAVILSKRFLDAFHTLYAFVLLKTHSKYLYIYYIYIVFPSLRSVFAFMRHCAISFCLNARSPDPCFHCGFLASHGYSTQPGLGDHHAFLSEKRRHSPRTGQVSSDVNESFRICWTLRLWPWLRSLHSTLLQIFVPPP